MIEKYLYILLQNHNEVIVPNLGAFLATYSSSQIQSSRIKPPHKKIVFYSQLNFDKNNLLKETLIHEEGLSEKEFENILAHFLNEIEQSITFTFKANLEKLGTLTRKPNGELQFEQAEDSNLLADSFGLPNLDFKPIASGTDDIELEKQKIVIPTDTEQKTNQEETKKEENTMNSDYNYTDTEEEADEKNSLLIWLLIIPLAFLFLFLIYFFFQKDEFENFKSYITGEDGEQITQVEEIIPEVTEDKSLDTTKIEIIEEDTTTQVEVVEEEETIPIKVEKHEPITVSGDGVLTQRTGRYYIIVGGFENMDTAKKFRQTLASLGYKVSFVPHNKRDNYYRVALIDFATEREAYNKRNELGINYPSAWVIKY